MDIFHCNVLSEILNFLDLPDLISALQVSKSFYNFGKEERVWDKFLAYFSPWFSGRGNYVHFQSEIRKYSELIDSLSIIYDFILQKLNKTCEISMNLEKLPSIMSADKLPGPLQQYPELYRYYRVCKGQSSAQITQGMFGTFKFYDHMTNYEGLSLRDAQEMMTEDLFPFALCRVTGAILGVDVEDSLDKGQGAVFESAQHMPHLYLAPSLLEFLSRYAGKIKNGMIHTQNNYVDLFEQNEHSSDCTTEGIRIKARSRFSLAYSRPNRFVWAYQIEIGPNSPCKRWKLTTRTWYITDSEGNKNSVVNQPGVIGMYPEVFEGSALTIYESCTPLSVPGGSMEGYFTFKNMDDPSETVDAKVATFQLSLPPGACFVPRE